MTTGIPFLLRKKDSSLTVRDGLITRIDPSFANLTGYPQELFLGRVFDDVLKKDLKATLSNPDIYNPDSHLKFFIFTRSLEPREVRTRTVQTRNRGEFTIIFSNDCNRRKQKADADMQLTSGEPALKEAYEKLIDEIKAEKEALVKELEMKNEFISFITHEFKTPLAVINSAVQAIEYLCKDELTDQFKGFLRKIKQNSFRQLRLVNNLLDITRINAGRYKVTNRNLDIIFLAREITESVRLYAQQKNIRLEFLPSMPAKTVGIDEEKFERIMLNLLSNAIKFTPANKSVSVVISEKDTPAGMKIAVQVRDEGVGIPKEKQQYIFERFGQVENSLTRETEGTGIGLSLVKKMVSVLGWTISVESEPGMGSTFEVLMPDSLAVEDQTRNNFEKFTDSRLIQATQIEFSEIYQ